MIRLQTEKSRPRLRHNSNPLCLRPVAASSASSQSCVQALSQEPRLQRPNNSFKPSPLRGLGQTGPQGAGRLNSGVRRRQTKIFSTWGSPAKRHRGSKYPSATYSVQLESSCTPSVDTVLREQLASAQNQFCAAGLNSFAWTRVRQVSQAKASLVSRLTIRSSRVRFAASDGGSYD